MKKTAVLIYDQFCNFEIALALELLALAGKPMTVFAKNLEPVKSEEGWRILPDATIDSLRLEEYDSLLLPGAADIRSAIEDPDIWAFIKAFDQPNFLIGAISIAPILLLRCGMLEGKRFMAGVAKEDLLEEGFTMDEMALMIPIDQAVANDEAEPVIWADNILTAVSFSSDRFAKAFAERLGLNWN